MKTYTNMKEQHDDIIEKTLRSLDLHSPSEDFSLRVLRKFQTANRPRKSKDYLPVVPKVLLGGFVMAFLAFFAVLTTHIDSIEISFQHGLTSMLMVVAMTMGGWLCFMGTDWMAKKITAWFYHGDLPPGLHSQ